MDKSDFYAEAVKGVAGPLDGVRVLDITTAWAGPMVACLLGDLGAEVIHVEVPNSVGGTPFKPNLPGTELPWSHQTVNRNKKSLAVDLRKPEGAEIALDVVRTVDIVVENFKPGTLAQWGVGYSDCRAVKSDIVYVSVSGYGQYGPWSNRPGYDPAALAVSGWMSLNGTVDGPPNKAPTFLADDLAGLHGALGAISALWYARHNGEGQHVDVSLMDSILFQSDGYPTLGAMGLPMKRMGNQVAPTVPCNAYECRNEEFIYLAIALDRHWAALARAMDRPELETAEGFATNEERVANRNEVDGLVAEWCLTQDRASLVDVLSDAGVVVAAVHDFAETSQHAVVEARDMLVPTKLTDGSVAPIVGPAAKFSRTRTTVRLPAPTVGQHTDELLDQLGYDDSRRAALRDAGVIS